MGVYNWGEIINVPDPIRYTDDFTSDKGYFSEDNGAANWKVEDGVYRCTAGWDDVFATRLHIYEKNVNFKARVRYVGDNPPDSIMGFIMRSSAEESFVKVNYRPCSCLFSIDSRDCEDLPAARYEVKKYPLKSGEWCDVDITLDGDRLTLKVNGEQIADVRGIMHLSPGRVGFYCERLTMEVDSTEITFLSGQGTLWKDCKHTVLPDEVYREGGSVTEMRDGSVIYQYHGGESFVSHDNGATWDRRDTWVKLWAYNSILRLNSGKLIRTVGDDEDGKVNIYAYISSDEGETWERSGLITEGHYEGNKNRRATNMNDKFNQAASGRIFYSQNYECNEYLDGKFVFCQFFYSDDDGATWTLSDTRSWELGDNNVLRFGECKLLECADGTVRVYSSWNGYGNVMYAESHDGGKTFGSLHRLEGFPSTCSSMQFVRDPYGETDFTYYMVWVNCVPNELFNDRSRISLAKTVDGKSWQFLGDVWRNECKWRTSNAISHCVDPFVKVTKTHVIAGSGISEKMGPGSHHEQRQHIWSVPKKNVEK